MARADTQMEEPPLDSLPGRVRALMAEKGVTTTELARRAGIDRADVSRFLNGKRAFRTEQVGWIAQSLGTELPALVEALPLDEPMKREVTTIATLLDEVVRLRTELNGVTAERDSLRQVNERQKAEFAGRLTTEIAARQAADRRAVDATEAWHNEAAARYAAEQNRDIAIAEFEAAHVRIGQLTSDLTHERQGALGKLILAGLGGAFAAAVIQGDNREG